MLVEHAKQELKLAGMFDKDSDYNGELANAVLELMEVFSKQGHSGTSAYMTIELFTKLASYQTLTPLSSNPDEWFKPEDDYPMWQSKRCPSVFSTDGGKTWYDLDGKVAPTRQELETK